MRTWRNETEWAAARFKEKGVHVINCTPGSALVKYPYIPLAKVFAYADQDAGTADRERHSAIA
jgi:hypothetical protein